MASPRPHDAQISRKEAEREDIERRARREKEKSRSRRKRQQNQSSRHQRINRVASMTSLEREELLRPSALKDAAEQNDLEWRLMGGPLLLEQKWTGLRAAYASARALRDRFGFEIPFEALNAELQYNQLQASVNTVERQQLIEHDLRQVLDPLPRGQFGELLPPVIRRLIYTGIPHHLRPRVWLLLSGRYRTMFDNRALFHDIVYKNRKNDCMTTATEVIAGDSNKNVQFIFSTTSNFSSHSRFGTVDGLHRLLNLASIIRSVNPLFTASYASHHVLAYLLITCEEEEVYWLMDALCSDYIPEYFTPIRVGPCYDQLLLEHLLKSYVPLVYARVVEQLGVKVRFLLREWIPLLFTVDFPASTVLRVFDVLFIEGPTALLRVALAVLHMCRDSLFAVESASEIFPLLRQFTLTLYDADELMRVAYDVIQFEPSVIQGERMLFRDQVCSELAGLDLHPSFERLLASTSFPIFDNVKLEALRAKFDSYKAGHELEDKGFNVEQFTKIMMANLKQEYSMSTEQEVRAELQAMFDAFDPDGDKHILFSELMCCLMLLCRDSVHHKLRFFFRVFDTDFSGSFSPEEFGEGMVVLHQRLSAVNRDSFIKLMCQDLFHSCSHQVNEDGEMELVLILDVIQLCPLLMQCFTVPVRGRDDFRDSLCKPKNTGGGLRQYAPAPPPTINPPTVPPTEAKLGFVVSRGRDKFKEDVRRDGCTCLTL